MKKILAPAILSALLLAAPTAAVAKAPIEGRWLNPKGNVTVRVAPCGEAYCATVIDATAKAKEKAAKGGTTHLVGTQVMRDFKAIGNGVYKGNAFDPKRNIRAPATIKMVGESVLVVKGCLLSGIVCKEQRWKRVG